MIWDQQATTHGIRLQAEVEADTGVHFCSELERTSEVGELGEQVAGENCEVGSFRPHGT